MRESTESIRRFPMVGIVLAVLALWGGACPTDETVEGEPSLQVAPSEIDFGVVALGVLAERDLVITNAGEGDLEVASVALMGGNGAFSIPGFSGTLEPDGSVTLTVSLLAVDEGPAEDAIRIVSDDAERPQLDVPVQVEDVTVDPVPDLEWDPPSLDWGEVPMGAVEALTVTLSSVGTGDLAIQGIDLSEESSADFSLVPTEPPAALAPGETFAVDLEYSPSDDEPDTGALVILSDDPDTPEATIPLSGGLLPQPDIELSPAELDFGAMDVGQTATLTAVVHNLGQLDLTLGVLSMGGSGDFSLILDPSSTVVAPGDITWVEVQWSPTVAGQAAGEVEIPSDDPDEPIAVLILSGDALPLGDIDVSPLTVDFGAVDVGASATAAVTVTNMGDAELTLGGVGINVSDEVELTADPSYAVLGPAETATVELTYEPDDGGVDTGSLWIPSDDVDEPLIEIPIQGEGVTEQDIDLDPAGLQFGPIEAGTTQALEATIANLGTGDLSLGPLTVTGNNAFAITDDPAGEIIPPGDDVTVEVLFSPGAEGIFGGAVEIASDDPDEPVALLSLAGEAFVLPDIEVDPEEVDFGLIEVGLTASDAIAVRNLGAGPLSVTSVQLSGGGELAFLSPDLPGTVPAGGEVTIEVTYTPVDDSSDVGSLTLQSDDPDEPVVEIELLGDGHLFADVDVSPIQIEFGEVQVDDVVTGTVQIANLGNDALVLTGCSVAGDTAFSISVNPCGGVVDAGDTVALELSFTPDAEQLFVGSVVVQSDDPDTPQVTVGLLGTGITAEIDVAPTQLDFGQLDIGLTASMDLEIRNQGTADLLLGALFMDGGAEFSLDVDPSYQVIAPGDTTLATVSYTPADLQPDTGELQIPSNDLDEPLVAIPLLGAHDPIADIHVDPQVLDFGTVDVGLQVGDTVTVNNQGTGDLWVDLPALTGNPDFDMDTTQFPCSLGPGESASLPVTYQPSDGNADTATITVTSDDVDEPSLEVSLSGTPTPEPGIYLMPPSLAFGQVQIGDAATLSASITSVGNGDLELGTLTVVGTGEFSLTTDPSGQTLAPGTWTVVEVTYAPVDGGTDTAQVEIPSNDPDEPVVVLELSGAEDPVPDIEVDPLAVDFGLVDQGLVASETVTVSNVGTASLTVTGISLSGSGDFSWSAVGVPGTLSPGDTGSLTVTYTPSDDVADTGTITLTSTDPDEGFVNVALSGQATPEPGILIDPDPLEFGDVQLLCEDSEDLAIQSVGGAPLTLTGYTFVESAPGGAMTFEPGDLQDYVDFGWELLPGEEIEVSVSFLPDDLLVYEALLTVSSDDPNQPDAELEVDGEGVPAGWITDSFTQTGNNWVDVLWVVDNSCSMWDEQGQLGDDFSYFYDVVEDAGVDYRIAVVSTDNADFQGANYLVIDNNTPNGSAEFEANCALGTGGYWVEQGLEYGYQALIKAQNNYAPNQDFWRDEALLLVIYVSDEPDGSGNWATYQTSYEALKADPDDVILSAICGTDGVNAVSCTGPGGSADPGYGYVDIANATGGILGCICDADWSATMSLVGWLATANVVDTFALTEEAIPGSIEVSVNGVPLLVGWVYDPPQNAIVFAPAYVPSYGDIIDVYYGYYDNC